VFKEGIKPMWEDSANRNGGRWLMEFPRKKDWKSMSYLDEIWLKVVGILIMFVINFLLF
jgi:translation initiation factor 4E